jgi:hypothetical protein
MNIISNLAATYTTSYRPVSTVSSDAPMIIGLILGYGLLILLLAAIYYVITALLMGSLFKKAGLKASLGWIPFYRYFKFLQLGGKPGGLIFISVGSWGAYLLGAICMTFLPALGVFLFVMAGAAAVVYYVFKCIAVFNISKKLDKDGIITIFYVVSELIWWALIVGTDKHIKWNDSAAKKRLDK